RQNFQGKVTRGRISQPATVIVSTTRDLITLQQRRVVVTGIGLICAVGNTTEEVWQNLVAGKSGITRITLFDAKDVACQIAAEVKNFDPLKFVEKKEIKKMARFIHLALAASEEAIKMSGLEITEENSTRIGVHIGSGIGGFGLLQAELPHRLNGRPPKIPPLCTAS